MMLCQLIMHTQTDHENTLVNRASAGGGAQAAWGSVSVVVVDLNCWSWGRGSCVANDWRKSGAAAVRAGDLPVNVRWTRNVLVIFERVQRHTRVGRLDPGVVDEHVDSPVPRHDILPARVGGCVRAGPGAGRMGFVKKRHNQPGVLGAWRWLFTKVVGLAATSGGQAGACSCVLLASVQTRHR